MENTWGVVLVNPHQFEPPVDNLSVYVRGITVFDLVRLFRWANNQQTRYNSLTRTPVRISEHLRWYVRGLSRQRDIRFIIEGAVDSRRPKPMMFCRIIPDLQGQFLVSVNVAPEFRGKGYSASLLAGGIEHFQKKIGHDVTLNATIRQDNIASLALFTRLGFTEHKRENDLIYLSTSGEDKR